jgi:hypothetical protein
MNEEHSTNWLFAFLLCVTITNMMVLLEIAQTLKAILHLFQP